MLQFFLYLAISEILVDSLHIYISDHLLNILYFVPGDSPALDIVDIDKDNGNPQMCASYVVEIYSNLMASEVCYCIFVKSEPILRSAFFSFYIPDVLLSLEELQFLIFVFCSWHIVLVLRVHAQSLCLCYSTAYEKTQSKLHGGFATGHHKGHEGSTH